MYIGYFIAVPIAVVIADAVWRVREGRTRILLQLAAAGVLAAAALAPVGAEYLSVRADYHQVRDISEVAGQRRRPAIVRGRQGQHSACGAGADRRRRRSGEGTVAGLFAVSLAALGFWTAGADPRRRRGPSSTAHDRDHRARLVVGPHVRIWGTVVTTHGSIRVAARDIVPGMNGMRVPARFAIIVVAGLSVLVGFGARPGRTAPRRR